MTDMLKRSIAPVTSEAWGEIDEAAVQVLRTHLTARTLVDFDGPFGWELGAVNLGRLEVGKKKAPHDVPWGLRQVRPLIEARIGCQVAQMELDSITRGAEDADLDSVEKTAHQIALFEEAVIYNGFKDAQIEGIIPASSHKAIGLPGNADEYHRAVVEAAETLRAAGVAGPYALVLGPDAHAELMKAGKGSYPPRRMVRDVADGGIFRSPALAGGALISTRGGDYRMTVGQDIAIGYASHDREKVELFFTESFTFRVIEPGAAVELKASG